MIRTQHINVTIGLFKKMCYATESFVAKHNSMQIARMLILISTFIYSFIVKNIQVAHGRVARR